MAWRIGGSCTGLISETLAVDDRAKLRWARWSRSTGRWGTQDFVTAIVGVAGHQLLDLVPGRNEHAAAGLLPGGGSEWLSRVRWA